MKKYSSILFAAAFAACSLSVSAYAQDQSDASEDKQLKIVTTIFPEYDWVKEIAGEEFQNMDVTMLLDNGVDLKRSSQQRYAGD